MAGDTVRCSLVFFAAAVVTCGPALARAQPRTMDPLGMRALSLEAQFTAGAYISYEPDPRAGIRPDGEPGAYLPDVPILSLGFDLSARVVPLGPVSEGLFLELDASLRVGWAELGMPGRRDYWLGSPWVALAVAHREESWTLRGGVGLGLPLAMLTDQHAMEREVPGIWGGWDAWHLHDRMVPVGFTGLYEARLRDIDAGADASLIAGPRFGVEGTGSGIDKGFWLFTNLGVWVSAHLHEMVRLGLRIQGALSWYFSREMGLLEDFDYSRAELQGAFVPFVRIVLPPGYVELRGQFNVNDPLGPSFAERDTVWAVALRGGLSWDP